MRQSRRMQLVQSPIIPVVAALIRDHPGTISLGQGVVHYGPPPQAKDALAGFFDDPQNNKYKPVHGIAPLLSAIERKLAAENGIRADDSCRVVVTAGGNMAFLNAILAIADAGDEVILLAPYYFNHEMAIAIANCRPVVVATDPHNQPDVAAIEAAITPRTRAVVSISPNNPTGAVYGEAALRALNALCRSRGLFHIHDEAYEYFAYDGAAHFSPGSIDGAQHHTISLFSLSKAYGFASWRIGYMTIPTGLFDAVNKIQDTNVICPPVISQCAAVGALAAGREWCRAQIQSIAQVRQRVLAELDGVRDVCQVAPAQGALYFLVNVSTKLDAMQLTTRLICEHGVAVLPGTTFGVNDRCALRVSYGALEPETVAQGIGRFVRGIRQIVRS